MPREPWRIEPTITSQYLEHAPTALVAATADQRILFANHRARALFGYEAEQMANQPMEHLIAPSAREHWTGLWQKYQTTRAPMEDLELTGLHRDAGEIPLRFTLGHIRLEHPSEASASNAQTILVSIRPERSVNGRPVTQSAVPESSMRDQRIQELEQRLEQRDRELADAYKELDSFNFSVSHDLRAPLRAIDGFSQILEEDHASSLDASAQRLLTRIRAASQRIGSLVDDLVSLSRLSRRDMEMETLDLSALAAEVAEGLRAAHPDHSVALAIAPGITGIGDRALVRALLENLLGNAWKYTTPCEDARVEFGVVTSESGSAYMIRDNGVGFDMQYAGKLFGPFQRMHTSEEFPGNGIGLATAAQIVRRHGGRIWGEGAVGQGASFYFTLAPAPGG